jgi:hypothetical protein
VLLAAANVCDGVIRVDIRHPDPGLANEPFEVARIGPVIGFGDLERLAVVAGVERARRLSENTNENLAARISFRTIFMAQL